MARKYFGTDGIRGKVGEHPMSPEFVLRLGWAAGRVFAAEGTGSVLIGKDTRISGYMFEAALEAGFSAAGVNVRMLGPMPTPGVAYLTKTFKASAGVVISASHNPYYDNGVKFFAPEGGKLSDELEEAIERQLEQPFSMVGSKQLGKASRVNDSQGRYIEFCKASLGPGISLQGMKIALDCGNGATYQVAPMVFSELGAKVVTCGIQPDGININDGCGTMHPESLQALVKESGADVGLAFDGDGDRVMMVDRHGRLIDGDGIIYVIASGLLGSDRLKGPVVGTLMSNLGLELALTGLGVDFVRTKVGDRYVLESLHERDGILGGEPSGHVICLDKASTGDGIISGLRVLGEMIRSQRQLDEMLEGMVWFPQVMLNVPTQQALAISAHPEVISVVKQVESKLAGKGRVVLRPSGTEPVVRVMVEGENNLHVTQFAQDIADVVRSVS